MKRLSAKAAKSKSQAGSVKVVTVRISSGTTVTGKPRSRLSKPEKKGGVSSLFFYIFQRQVSLGLRTTGSGSSRFSSP